MVNLHRSMVAAAAVPCLALAFACSGDDDPSVEISAPEDGATIGGNVVELALEVDGIEIAATGDESEDGDTGQFAVFIDKDPVEPGEAIPADDPDVVQTADNPIQLPGLSIGEHRLVVVIGDREQERIGEAVAETTVDVGGPTLSVTGPATADVGSVLQVEIEVEGVELVEAADDESENDGSAGHLHVFVNKEPTGAGDVTPTDDPAILHTTSQSVAFPADLFEEGTNTITVALAYADETPFDPPVMDRMDIEVS